MEDQVNKLLSKGISALSKKLNPDNFVENAILSLLTYEPKPPSYLYNQLQEIFKKIILINL